jgi:hypothetical protein
MTEIRSEDEVFRAFRLTQCEADQLTDGQLLGGLLRFVTEMLSRDQSGAVVAHMRHQADLAEAMLPPRAERPPPPQWHPWRRYIYRLDPAFDDPVPAKDKAVETDVALASGEALDGAEFHDGDDEPIPEQPDRQLVEARIKDALDDVFETDAEARREAERFEAELLAKIYGGGSNE